MIASSFRDPQKVGIFKWFFAWMIIFHPPKNPEEIRVAKQEDTVIICSNRRLEIIFFPILVNVEIRVILGRRECMEHYQTTKCFCKSTDIVMDFILTVMRSVIV